MGAGDVADGVLLGLLGPRVDDGDHAGDAGLLEGRADQVIELAGAEEGEDGALVLSLVAVQDLDGSGSQVHLDYARAFLFSLAGDILHGDAVVGGYNVAFSEGEQVADTAADIALEDEDVAGGSQLFVITHIRLVKNVAFLGGEVVGGAVLLGADGVFAEGVVLRVAHVDAPAPIGTDGAHVADDGVVAAFTGCAFVFGVVPDVFVLLDGLQPHAVLQLAGLKERVLSAKEVFQGEEGAGRSLVQLDFLAGVHLEALDDAEDCAVGVYALLGDLLVFEELLGLVLEAEFALVGLGVVLGEDEAVDGVLQPVGAHIVHVGAVALLGDLGADALVLGFGGTGLFDFLRLAALVDDDFFTHPVLGLDEGTRVCALRDLTRITVASQDLGLAGVLVRDRGESEC